MLLRHVEKPCKANAKLSFLEPKTKKAPTIIEKALAREGFRNSFSRRRKPYKTNEKPLFQKSKIAITKPYKNQGQMQEIWSKIAKRPPESLKKHYLEKVFAS